MIIVTGTTRTTVGSQKMIKFIFDEKMIDEALKANGWSSGWNSADWCHETDNPDYVFIQKKKHLLNC